MGSKSVKKRESAERALENFLKDYVNSGRMDMDLAELSASQRIQAVTRLLPYCLPKAKDLPKESGESAPLTGNETLALFFSRLK